MAHEPEPGRSPDTVALSGLPLRRLYPVSAYLAAAAEAGLDMNVVAQLVAAVTGEQVDVVLATLEQANRDAQ